MLLLLFLMPPPLLLSLYALYKSSSLLPRVSCAWPLLEASCKAVPSNCSRPCKAPQHTYSERRGGGATRKSVFRSHLLSLFAGRTSAAQQQQRCRFGKPRTDENMHEVWFIMMVSTFPRKFPHLTPSIHLSLSSLSLFPLLSTRHCTRPPLSSSLLGSSGLSLSPPRNESPSLNRITIAAAAEMLPEFSISCTRIRSRLLQQQHVVVSHFLCMDLSGEGCCCCCWVHLHVCGFSLSYITKATTVCLPF